MNIARIEFPISGITFLAETHRAEQDCPFVKYAN